MSTYNNSSDHVVTQYNVLTGGSTNLLNNVAPSATSGIPLVSSGSSSQPSFTTAVVAGGGTGDTSFTAYAPICGGTSTTGALQSASSGMGTSGYVLTSTGSSSLPTWQSAGSSGITTIDGDSGSVTGSTVTLTSGNASLTCGSSVLFTGSGTTITMTVSDNSANTVVGRNCGNSTMLGLGAGNNSVLGYYSLHSATTGSNNIVVGNYALRYLLASGKNVAIGTDSITLDTTADSNIAIGSYSLSSSASGSTNNIAIGTYSMGSNTGTMTFNTAIGDQSMNNAQAGASYNTCLGASAGLNYTGTESNNILINNSGTASESNVLRIGAGTGTSTQQLNKAVICGIYGSTSASGTAVLVNSSNVLGTTPSALRYKNNVADMGDLSSRIYGLRPVTFNYKIDGTHVNEEDSCVLQYGLIAEEVENVIPEMIVYNKNGEVETIRYQHLAPMLLNELQKAIKRIEALEKKLAEK